MPTFPAERSVHGPSTGNSRGDDTLGNLMLDTAARERLLMHEHRFDAVVAQTSDNVIYVAGFTVPSHLTNRFRRTFCVLPLDGAPTMVVVAVEESLARARSTWITDIRAYNEFTEDPADVLADVLKERNLSSARIGLELDAMAARDYLRLRDRLPNAKFAACTDVFFEARMLKTPREISEIRRLGHIASAAHGRAYAQLKHGMTERELSRLLVDACSGVDYVRTIIGSGERSAHPNANPTDRALATGDVVRVDLIAGGNWYHSDIARTSVIGVPTSEQSGIWRTLMRAYGRVQEALRPGARTRDLHHLYLQSLADGKLDPSLQFLGHGLGLTVHEEPYINAYADRVLEPGMVLCIEPVYLVPGRMGFHVEDEFLITPNGFELLSPDTANDRLIEIE